MSAPATPASDGPRGWLEERLGLAELIALGRAKRIPMHRHSIWYYLGGMTLFLFGLQVATGILLLLYYRPSSGEAFESVQFIMTRVPFGWLVRSIHAWSANLLMLTVLLHMLSVFFLKAYRRPRELTWLTGLALLGLMMAFGFSGYLLPWNTLSFFATQVGTQVAGTTPLVGDFLLRLMRGGDQVTGGTLTRFYGIHVAVLPALTTLLLGAHLLLVQRHGMSVPPGVESESERTGRPVGTLPFFPSFLLRDAIGWCGAVGVLAGLAAFLPWELGAKADAFAPAPAGIRPEWYFVWMFETLKQIPNHVLGVEGELVGLAGFAVGGALCLLVPFLDRNPRPGDRRGRLFTLLGVLALGYVVAMTAVCYLGPSS